MESPGTAHCFRADRGDAGGRLDLAVVRHCAGLPAVSRSRAQAWIGAGRVRVNGGVAQRSAGRLTLGDQVEIALPAPPPPRAPIAAQPLPLSVLFEDEHLLALDKPAGLLVHPTGRHRDGTLVNALVWYLQRPGQPAVRPGLVHRLDRDTTGVLLVAKTPAAQAGLARAIRARALDKDYLAVVHGRPPHAKGRIELGLLRDPQDRRRVIASRHQGRPSVTLYEELATGAGAAPAVAATGTIRDAARCGGSLSLLRCRLLTGRTHQIRVHLAALGLPLVGDPLYGEPRHRGLADPRLAAFCGGFSRQALHAHRLGLSHPVSGEPLDIVAPLPADLADLLRVGSLRTGSEHFP